MWYFVGNIGGLFAWVYDSLTLGHADGLTWFNQVLASENEKQTSG